MTREVVVVPHTHWDREWYEPFQTFRLKLVDLVDELLPLLEGDPAFRHFMLDGQMAVVDDYLAVRPEQAERIRSLAGSGRLGMGPWYILMDEFLVSGETDGARSPARVRSRRRVRWRDGGRLPAGHVRPHRADAPDPPAVRPRARGGVARRSLAGRPERLLVDGAGWIDRAGRIPPRGLRQRRRAARRRQGARRPGGPLRARPRVVPPRAAALDERQRPPAAEAVAGPGDRGGQRAAGRLRVPRRLAGRVPPRRADRRPPLLVR